jgi:CheY-like chemotaxis protein
MCRIVLVEQAVESAVWQSPLQPEMNAGHLEVLFAKDNNVNQKLVLILLKKLGVNADLVSDGVQAIEPVEKIPYDLILMDVEMPVLDGLTVTRQIRSLLPLDQQPAIFGLTAHLTG